MKNLTFNELSNANKLRCDLWDKNDDWTAADKMVELIGELGEAANIMKKIRRIECGMIQDEGSLDILREQLRDEIGDTQISLSLLANKLDIDLGRVTALKFNKTSRKYNFPIFIITNP